MPISALTRELVLGIRDEYPEIRTLNLARNEIEEISSLEILASHLISLDLSWNRITDVGFGLLCLVHLKQLVLAHNEIRSLQNTNFTSLKRLIRLDLSNNLLRDKMTTVTALETLDSLSDLNLTENAVDTTDWLPAFKRSLPGLNVYNLELVHLSPGESEEIGATRITSLAGQVGGGGGPLRTTGGAPALYTNRNPQAGAPPPLTVGSTAEDNGAQPPLPLFKSELFRDTTTAGGYASTSCGGGGYVTTTSEEEGGAAVVTHPAVHQRTGALAGSSSSWQTFASGRAHHQGHEEQTSLTRGQKETLLPLGLGGSGSGSATASAATRSASHSRIAPDADHDVAGRSSAVRSRFFSDNGFSAATSTATRGAQPLPIVGQGGVLVGSGPAASSTSGTVIVQQHEDAVHGPLLNNHTKKYNQDQQMTPPSKIQEHMRRILVEPAPSPIDNRIPAAAIDETHAAATDQVGFEHVLDVHQFAMDFLDDLDAKVAREGGGGDRNGGKGASTASSSSPRGRDEGRLSIWRQAVWELAVQKRCLEIETQKQIREAVAEVQQQQHQDSQTRGPEARTDTKSRPGGGQTDDEERQDSRLASKKRAKATAVPFSLAPGGEDDGLERNEDEPEDTLLQSKKRANSRKGSRSRMPSREHSLAPPRGKQGQQGKMHEQEDHDHVELMDDFLAGQKSSRRGSFAPDGEEVSTGALGTCFAQALHDERSVREAEVHDTALSNRKRTHSKAKSGFPDHIKHPEQDVVDDVDINASHATSAASATVNTVSQKQYQFDEEDLVKFVDEKVGDRLDCAKGQFERGGEEMLRLLRSREEELLRRIAFGEEKIGRLEGQLERAKGLLIELRDRRGGTATASTLAPFGFAPPPPSAVSDSVEERETQTLQLHATISRLRDEKRTLEKRLKEAEEGGELKPRSEAPTGRNRREAGEAARRANPTEEEEEAAAAKARRKIEHERQNEWRRKFLAAQEQLQRYEQQAAAAWEKAAGEKNRDRPPSSSEDEKEDEKSSVPPLTTTASANNAGTTSSGEDLVSMFRGLQKMSIGRLQLPQRTLE